MVRKIPLSSIQPEEQFRQDIEDLTLTLSIKMHGLQKPLLVEGPTDDNKYILIEGYRRFYSLQQIGCTEVPCIIHDITNKARRVIKRLRNELHRKKKTGYELERMIQFLLENNYTIDQIAQETNVTKKTIQKHIKSLDIDPEAKKQAEKIGAGKDGLTRLLTLSNTFSSVIDTFKEKYLEKAIFSYHVDSFERVVNIKGFKDLPAISQEKCLLEAMNQAKFGKNQAKKIVYAESLKYHNGQEAALFIFEEIYSNLEKVISYCHPNLINGLNKGQISKLHALIETLAQKTRIPEYWNHFPQRNASSKTGNKGVVININKKQIP